MNDYVGDWHVILSQSKTFPEHTNFTITLDPSGNYLVKFPESECKPAVNPIPATVEGGNLASLAFAVSCATGRYSVRMLPPIKGRLNGSTQLIVTAGLTEDDDADGDPVGTWTAEEEGGQVYE